MILRRIEIVDFKNIGEAMLELSPGVNCFVGRNGMGKSNLLEAVYFLSMARPMESFPENTLIRHGREQLLIKGDYSSDMGTGEQISIGVTKGKGKRLYRNGKEYQKLSEHIGRFPIVAATPADSQLVTQSGEVRRRLMDMVISQTDPAYLSHLIRYNRSLDSRNRMLRSGVRDKLLYESVETMMADSAAQVNGSRRKWTESVEPGFRRYYAAICGDTERVGLRYESALSTKSLSELLDDARARDSVLGFTTVGVHRDDLLMQLGDYPLKRTGSQGQIKSYVLALRFAIYDHIRNTTGLTPILLLDDIFDKLDSSRVSHIMEAVSAGSGFGQIFITDTNREHLDETVSGLQGESSLFGVEAGQFKPIER